MTRVDVSRKTCLLLTGRPIGKRFEVVLNGRSLALTGTSFYYLFRLSHQALTTVDGWIAGDDNRAGQPPSAVHLPPEGRAGGAG
jgi:hypothetical protein